MAVQVLSKSSLKDLAEVRRRVLGTARDQTPAESRPIPRSRWYWGKLTSDLDAPTNGMSGATTATFDIWLPDGTESTPEVLIQADDTDLQGLTLVNRMTGLSAASGTTIQVERDGREWTLKGIDCP